MAARSQVNWVSQAVASAESVIIHPKNIKNMEDLEESKPTCPVCLEPGQNLCHLQPCQHEFCQNCVASLTEQNPKFLCPLCRTPVKNTKKYWTKLRKWVCCLVILIVFAGIFALLWFHNPKWQEVKTSWNHFDADGYHRRRIDWSKIDFDMGLDK